MAVNWTHHVDALHYDGEAEQRRLELETATIVVTSHRVLAFDRSSRSRLPGTHPYRHVDRPNVQHVTVSQSGSTRHLLRSLLTGAIGLTLLTTAAVVSFGELVPELELDGTAARDRAGTATDAGDAAGTTAAVDSTFETLGVLFQILDTGVLVGGILSLALAAVFAGLYIRSRSRQLVLQVAGGDDIAVPLGETDDAAPITLSLSEAIQPGPTADQRSPAERAEFSRSSESGESHPRGDRWRGRDESG
ncbi:hypothetical protein [Natrialba asiatica]|uniref:Uncharacterized protein n=1 Tax=Natrialba asiatica (strain ATCC 700177 / DSM 12278 / JCM 9576 / FERM P-10747 / NBRC 102637 / 172P1) TaxID=29540 RepID=M0AKQ2_NATA1|nr:hypothetical protein [Natrialba asiatica]ELY98487.1 hypothetical protein C481_17697 [Natrialba asiatica DSM 12278]